MSFTGGISFYEKNKALAADNNTIAATSNNAAAKFAIGTDKYLNWESSGSDDTTTEKLTITLNAPRSISRIFILNHNLKDFRLTYDDDESGNPQNVEGMDGTESNFTITNNERTTNYYEFDAVISDTFTLHMTKTIAPDNEKSVNQIILTNELGTLEGYPNISAIAGDRDAITEKAITGRQFIQKQYESFDFSMTLRSYPFQNDVDLLDSLHDMEESFLVWLCGGLPDQFRIKSRGWRAQDVFLMQVDGRINNGYSRNVYSLGVDQIYRFSEVVR